MTTQEATEEIEVLDQAIEHVALHIPFGLMGFESQKNYVLISDPAEQPFMWLQMQSEGEQGQSFLVISPFVVHPGYSPEFSDEEMDAIGIENADEALLLNIVTIHQDGLATVNLKGPIVINRNKCVGKQIIPLNVTDYYVDHPIQTESNLS